ncbi:MAG: hypothetical protein HY658_03870 [Actinobacteria bacterium]|nr:hypothetical protein [Actinomycetota bacterium]
MRRWLLPVSVLVGLLVPVPARAADSWVRVPLVQTVSLGHPADLWTHGASALDLEYTAAAPLTFIVEQNGKTFPPPLSASFAGEDTDTQTVHRVPAAAAPTRISVQWAFPVVNQHFTIRWVSGAALALSAVWVGGPNPAVVSQPDLPLMVLWGDSILKGRSSGARTTTRRVTATGSATGSGSTTGPSGPLPRCASARATRT